MLLIQACVKPSQLHGLGVFAAEFVPRGTPVWRLEAGFDHEFTRERFDALPAPAQAHVRHFGYLDPRTGLWTMSGDLAIFMNHASPPNTGALPGTQEPVTTVALRDIGAGEELTCDYFAFDGAAERKLGPKDQTEADRAGCAVVRAPQANQNTAGTGRPGVPD